MRPSSIRHLFLAPLCGLVALLCAACGGSAHAVTSAPHRSSPLESVIESDFLVNQNPTAAIGRFAALGAQVVRYDVLWSSIAPHPASTHRPAGLHPRSPGGYPAANWGLLDQIDRTAAADGMRLYLTLTGPPPAWAHAAGGQGCGSCAQFRPDPAAYGDWVQAVGTRYDGRFRPPGSTTPLPRVSFWSLWNEPNYGPDLAPQSSGTTLVIDQSAPIYRRLLAAGWQGLAASGHRPGSDTILIGETAPVGEVRPGIDNMTPPRQFLRDLFCLTSSDRAYRGFAARAEGCPDGGSAAAFRAANPALFLASGWADHPYDYVVAPTVAQGSGPPSQDFADFARLNGLARDLDAAQAAYGAHPGMLIDNTEFGYFTGLATHYTVPYATAARWLDQSEYLAWSDPRIGTQSQYLLEDPPAGQTKFPSGIEFAGGRPKPQVADAYRLPLWLPRTHGRIGRALTVWGCARPAVRPGASPLVKVEWSSGGGHYRVMDTVQLSPATRGCYFETHVRFPGSGSVRLGYTAGHAHLHSRVEQVVLS